MSKSSPDTGDLDPGAVGLETTASNDIIPAGEMSTAMPERPFKPQPPPKKAHLEEVVRLMKELEEMREEQRQAEEMTDLMGQDLQIAQEAVEKKDDELKRKEVELLKCREELKNCHQRAQRLLDQDKGRQIAGVEKSITMPEVAVSSGMDNGSDKGEEILRLRDQVANLITALAGKDAEKKEAGLQSEEELSYLRKQVEQLTTSLTEKEAQWKSIGSRSMKELVYLRKQATQLKSTISDKDAELTKKVALAAGSAYDQWQATIQDKKLEFETTLRETEERLSAQLAQEQKLRRTAEATLQETREEMLTNPHPVQDQTRDQQLLLETTYKENEERLKAQLTQEQNLRRALEAEFNDTREKMGKNSSQEQELRDAAEASLRNTKEEYEKKLREADERAGAQLTAMQKRAQEAETSLHEHATRVQEVGIDQESLTRRIQGLESEVQDQRSSCAWFKKNSERLSREIKEAEAARRQLEQSEYAVKRQVADLKSQITVLQPRRSTPGAH